MDRQAILEDIRSLMQGPLDGESVEGRARVELEGHASAVTGLAFNPDGTRIATSSGDSTVKLWDPTEGEELLTLASSPDANYAVDNININSSADAMQFDGFNDYVTFGSATSLGVSNFTVECWFKRAATGQTTTTGSGGVTAVPLVTKGRSEADGSNVDCDFFLGINNTNSELAADFEDLATGLNHSRSSRPVHALS